MQAALSLIKRYEGCSLKSYLCPAGVWTIGYGWTHGVRPGMVWTLEQAEKALLSEVQILRDGILGLIKVPLSENKLDALVSLCYNIGLSAFKKSTLLKLINEGKLKEAGEQFLRWNKIHGVPSSGLTFRRAAEKQVWDCLP